MEDPTIEPQNLRLHPKTEDIQRAWLMVNAPYSNDLPALAVKIIDDINGHEDPENADLSFKDIGKTFAIRADITRQAGANEPYHIIVPVNAGNEGQIDEMVRIISEMEGVEAVHKALVIKHVPDNPFAADGFVAYQEENQSRGTIHKEGHNPWG